MERRRQLKQRHEGEKIWRRREVEEAAEHIRGEEKEGNREIDQKESQWDEGRKQREVHVEEDEKKEDDNRQNRYSRLKLGQVTRC